MPHTAQVGRISAAEAGAHHWDGVYAHRGERGVSWFAQHPTVALALLEAAGVDREQPVLDVGAGASRLVDELLARGYSDVTALDVSDEGLAVSRARLGAAADQVRWVVTDLLGWTPERRVALWHDRAVFHFLTDPADRARYRAVCDAALAPDGVLVIATFAEDGPQACSGLPTARYSPEQLLDTLGGADRWIELARRREDHTTPSDVLQRFTWLALRRRTA